MTLLCSSLNIQTAPCSGLNSAPKICDHAYLIMVFADLILVKDLEMNSGFREDLKSTG